ncbi:MAG: hypothetical protein AAGF10_00585 [Verrucomicrobiota bacterium]
MHPHLTALLTAVVLLGALIPVDARELSAQAKLQERKVLSKDKALDEKTEQVFPKAAPIRQEVKAVAHNQARISDDSLRELLREFAQRYPNIIGTEIMNDVDSIGDYRTKRNSVVWQYSSISNIQNICRQPNPRVALIDLVTYTTRAREYIAGEIGKQFLGDFQPSYVEVMNRLDRGAWALADFVLNDQDYQTLQHAVTTWVEKNPMEHFFGRQNIGALAGERYSPPPSETLSGGLFFGDMQQSMGDTVTQLQQANRSLEDFHRLIDWMPVYAFWMGEIAFYNFLDSDEGEAAIDFAKKLGTTQMRLGELSTYFAEISKVVQPFALAMQEPEHADLPDKVIDALEQIDSLSVGLVGLEDSFNRFLGEYEGKTMAERMANIDNSLEQLGRLSVQAEKVLPAVEKMGDYAQKAEEITRGVELLVYKGIAVFFLALLLYRLVSLWLENKFKPRTPPDVS